MRSHIQVAFRRIALTFLAVVASSAAMAATLTEFQLPAGSQPTDIDVDPGTGDIFFLDPPSQTINRLSGGTLRQWTATPFCPLTPLDKIAVANTALLNPAVYSTSIASSRICLFNPSTPPAPNVIKWYNLPGIVSSPTTLSVDPMTGMAWFSSFILSGLPVVASLDPTTDLIHLWVLPPGVANPGDSVDGLEFDSISNQLFFSVAGSLNQICVITNPGLNPSPTNCYPMPFTASVPIRVNSSNQVYRMAGLGLTRIARLDTLSNILTQWATPSPTDIFISPVDPPFFTSFDPAANQVDLTIAGFDSPILPIPFNMFSDFVSANDGMVNLGWSDFAPTTVSNPMTKTTSGAIISWSMTAASSSGPLTVDPLGAVWISETASGMIGTFQP